MKGRSYIQISNKVFTFMKKMMPMMLVMILIVLGAAFYAYQGVAMQGRIPAAEDSFHAAQDAYFSISKAERDSAATGSQLNAQLVEIKNYPSALLELKLVGVGKILTGIFLILLAILMALVMMPVRLGQLIRKNR
ncbi:MAG: hypothetical protein JKX80_00770 [Candidatus Pacebacteria bacterium]|nr:hypothetical protein [Candidatus Paceibacterota bacterium]